MLKLKMNEITLISDGVINVLHKNYFINQSEFEIIKYYKSSNSSKVFMFDVVSTLKIKLILLNDYKKTLFKEVFKTPEKLKKYPSLYKEFKEVFKHLIPRKPKTKPNNKKTKKQKIEVKKEVIDVQKENRSLNNTNTVTSYTCSWCDVDFEDGHLKVKHPKYQTKLAYPFAKSRKSFEAVRDHIESKLQSDTLIVHLKGYSISRIEGINDLYKVLELTPSKRNYKVLDSLKDKPKGEILRDAMKKKSNAQLLQIFTIDPKKKKYIKKLSEKQLEDYKIIPVVEKVKLHNTYTEHDSFIFTVKTLGTSEKVSLIWESCLSGKATHIFTTNIPRYDKIVNNLETFITAEEGYKRSNLWDANPSLRQSLGYQKSLKHISSETLIDWWFKIRNIIRN